MTDRNTSEPAQAKRGRPPGTGKNDTDRLRKIAELMAADPALKPTTAIKLIGETDPSAIRRLRDKFHEAQPALMADLGVPVGLIAAAAAPRGAEASQRAAPLARTTQKRTAPIEVPVAEPVMAVAALAPAIAPVAPVIPTARPVFATPAPTAPTDATAPEPASKLDLEALFRPAPVQDPYLGFGSLFGNGMQTAAVLFEHQMAMAQSVMKAAPMKLLWRQQIVATEYLLLLTSAGQRIGTGAQQRVAR
jgi:hypothetical protein